MSIQFEWQAGRDDGQWETIAESQKGPLRRLIRRMPWWAWLLVVLVVGGLATIGYVTVRQRYREAQQQIEFQIQSVIDLEARAFVDRDIDLFLDQQDPAQRAWLNLQGRRVQPDCTSPTRGARPRDRTIFSLCAPVQPAQVQRVDLKGDLAWVEVIESLPADPGRGLDAQEVRRVRFYRQTDLGWKHMAPPDAFWPTVMHIDYGNLTVIYHKRDQPYVEPLEEVITDAFVDVCSVLTCISRKTLIVEFSVEPPAYYLPAIDLSSAAGGEDKITLSSPWLAGIPVQASQETRLAKELAHAVTFAAAARSVQYTTGLPLTPLQRAILDEYAAWYAYGQDARLVLLRPFVEERGWDAMPDALLLATEPTLLDEFLARWDLAPRDDVAQAPEHAADYFSAVLTLEREALLLGRKETFLLLQDDEWRDLQERYYWQTQENKTLVPSAPVRVWSAYVLDDRARIILEGPLPSVSGLPPQSSGDTVFLLKQDGGWRHASVLDAFTWSWLSPEATPTPVAERRSD
jgi:hypothetical protein